MVRHRVSGLCREGSRTRLGLTVNKRVFLFYFVRSLLVLCSHEVIAMQPGGPKVEASEGPSGVTVEEESDLIGRFLGEVGTVS